MYKKFVSVSSASTDASLMLINSRRSPSIRPPQIGEIILASQSTQHPGIKIYSDASTWRREDIHDRLERFKA